ncbi:hypothetical protein HQ524_01050 [Candidatus Uhrbacteria bacterium]|nr:hypothetical protein [Candidatus Uhrbacteria bacterium]
MKLEFKNLRASAKPSDEFKKRLWQRLDAELEEPVKQSYIRRYVYVFGMVTIVITTMGTGTYAYAADTVTPDSTLYGVKAGIESVESVFHRSPESMSMFHMRMVQRRNKELDHVVTPEARQKLEDHLVALLGVTEDELKSSEYGIEKRQVFQMNMKQIHDQRFREQADAQHDELLRRLNELEVSGEVPVERAEYFREEMESMETRKIYKLRERMHELEDMREPLMIR